MPDLGLLMAPGLGLLIAAAVVAGIGVGFAGFGAALVFLPLALVHFAPVEAVGIFSIAMLGTLGTLAPRHARRADRGTTLTILACGTVGMVAGLPIMVQADPFLLRVAICVLGIATVVALGMGLRYRVPDGRWSRGGLGLLAGASWGAFGLVSPVFALVGLGYRGEARATRDGIALALPILNVLLIALLWGTGLLTDRAIALGLAGLPIMTAATVAGRALHGEAHAFWKATALFAAGLAAVIGLPAFA